MQGDRQAQKLSEALSEITELKAQLEEERVEQEDEEDGVSRGSEGEQVTAQPADEPENSLVCACVYLRGKGKGSMQPVQELLHYKHVYSM